MGPGKSEKSYQERIIYVLENDLNQSDLSGIQNLTIWCESHDDSQGTNSLTIYIASILSHIGNVQHVTVVSKIHRLSCVGQNYRYMAYSDYKFLDGTTVPGADIAVREVPILGSSIYLSKEHVDLDDLEILSRLYSPIKWKVPAIENNIITTLRGEELLLESAMTAKKKTGEPVLLD